MVKMNIVYEGGLHCQLTHGPSGSVIETDAPVDNHGKGERFSPTDMLCASLGACILTTLGIWGNKHGVNVDGSKAQVIKEMVTEPTRRVGKITVNMQMAKGIPQEKRVMVERVAHACPVHKSLHPDVVVELNIAYSD